MFTGSNPALATNIINCKILNKMEETVTISRSKKIIKEFVILLETKLQQLEKELEDL